MKSVKLILAKVAKIITITINNNNNNNKNICNINNNRRVPVLLNKRDCFCEPSRLWLRASQISLGLGSAGRKYEQMKTVKLITATVAIMTIKIELILIIIILGINNNYYNYIYYYYAITIIMMRALRAFSRFVGAFSRFVGAFRKRLREPL
jgi:hypothetical protein